LGLQEGAAEAVVLLDTSVVSTELRRRAARGREAGIARQLDRLLATDRPIAVPGIVLQEVLSGIREEDPFDFRDIARHAQLRLLAE